MLVLAPLQHLMEVPPLPRGEDETVADIGVALIGYALVLRSRLGGGGQPGGGEGEHRDGQSEDPTH